MMRSRGSSFAILAVLAAALAACAPVPSIPAPTAAPVTAVPVETSVSSPLPTAEPVVATAEVVTPTLSVAITPTVEIAGTTAEAVPAIAGTPIVAGTTAVSPTITNGRPLASAPTVQMATYRDEVGGFEIDYPATWSVVDVARDIKQQSQSYSITFTSWAPQEPGGQGIPDGGSKVDVSVTKGGAASPEAAAESRRRELAAEGSSQIIFEEPWDLPGNLAATHWTLQPSNGPAIEEVVTAINGNRILISGMGDSTTFQQIASSLRPLTPSEDSAVTMSGAAPATEAGAAEGQAKVTVPMISSGGAGVAAAPTAATTYTVRQGDTLAKIAARFGVSVSAILKANPQITNADRIFIGQRITIPGGGGTQPPPATTPVNIYLIGIGGGSVGCGDQVVAVRREVPKTAAPLTAALNLLLAQKDQHYGESGLYNALYQSDLRIASITRSRASWTIYLTGTLKLGGVCDNPRVKAQLEETARQFSTVTSVKYFINGQPLDAALSEK